MSYVLLKDIVIDHGDVTCILQKDIVPDNYDKKDPEHKTIYRFIRTLFNAAQLTAECAIVTLVSLRACA